MFGHNWPLTQCTVLERPGIKHLNGTEVSLCYIVCVVVILCGNFRNKIGYSKTIKVV